ncbi:MAG: PAS domain S-box protein [Chlorobiales bacterium]|nr:PAS domain S-box protein [Chlorobiales bacterium]
MRNTQDTTHLRHTNDDLQERIALLEETLHEQKLIVAEHQRIAESLRKSEEVYRSLFKNMPNGLAYCRILFKDTIPDDFIYLSVNDAFEPLTGLKDVVGKRATDVVPGIKRTDPKLFEIYGRVAQTGHPERFEMYIEALKQWFSISVYSPEKEHFVAEFNIVTEHRQAELAAQESEDRFRSLIEGSPEAIFIQTEGKFAYVNQAAASLFGAKLPYQLLGQSVANYFHPDFQAKAAELTHQTNVEQRAVPRQEEVILQSGGKPVDIEASSIPFVYKGKKGGLVFLRDITDRKLADKELQVALTKYKTLFQSFPLGITVADSTGQIVEANRMAEKLLGLSPEEHQDRRIDSKDWQVVRFDGSLMPAEEFASVRALKENRMIENVEMGIVKKSGKINWISVTACPLSLNGYGVVITYTDITERKHAQDELHRNKMRLHLAMESANAGTWEWDLRTNENIWSEEIWKLYGLRPNSRKATYELWLETVHPDDRDKTQKAVQDAVRRGSELNVEWRVIDKGKKERWLMARGKPLRNIAEQLVSFIGITIDITYRKRAELALKEESVRRRILFEQAKDGIVVIDRDRKVVEANKSFADMLGYTKEEMQQLYTWDWDVNYSTREQMLAVWPELPTTRDTIETSHRRKDGSVYDVEISWNPTEWGDQMQLYCVCRDITERKRAEAALKESAVHLHQALTAAQAGAWEVNLLTGEHTWSEELWKLFGFEPDSRKPSFDGWLETIHPDDRDAARRHMEETVNSGSGFVYEWRMPPNQNGKERWLMSKCTPLRNDNGKLERLIGIVIDITDRKQADKDNA